MLIMTTKICYSNAKQGGSHNVTTDEGLYTNQGIYSFQSISVEVRQDGLEGHRHLSWHRHRCLPRRDVTDRLHR